MAAQPTITSASATGTNDDNVIFGKEQTEADRLEMQHRVLWDANPKPLFAPIDLARGGFEILDQATGTGIFMRDMRDTTNGASNTWVGTDIEDDWFPPNEKDMTFHHQSMTEPWPKEWEGRFDLVHSRMALPGVGTNPLDEAVRNLIALVKPGGWIQLVEMEWCEEMMKSGGPWTQKFTQAIKELFSMVSSGQGVDLREKLTPMLEAAGLVNIDYKILVTPFGALANEKIRPTSEASLFATSMGVSMTTKMLPPLSISREDLDAMPPKMLEEVKQAGWKMTHFALWGQKPIPA